MKKEQELACYSAKNSLKKTEAGCGQKAKPEKEAHSSLPFQIRSVMPDLVRLFILIISYRRFTSNFVNPFKLPSFNRT